MAAVALRAHLALKDVPVARAVNEAPAVYAKRLADQGKPMDAVAQALSPVKGRLVVRDASKENAKRWARIGGAARRLPNEIAAYRKSIQSGAASRVQPAFMAVRRTIWHLYSEMRDARP